jgi:hypothetical protein
MRFSIPVLVLCVVAVTVVGAGEAPEQPTLVRVTVTDARQAREVGGLLNLDEATRGFDLVGWALPEDLSKLGALGYSWTHVDEPRSPEALTMCSDPDGGTYDPPYAWNCYPTWEQYEDMLEYYATNFPEICRLVNIGPSGEGTRALYALKISDNPDAEEAEPEFLYTGTMHGDELAGYPLLLRLADELLTNYTASTPDPALKSIVNDTVLWINPLANPDGTFAGGNHTVSGSQRYYTTTSIDPNRSFPDPPETPSPVGRAPETQAMMALAESESFTMAANFHGGAEVVNYPWDTFSERHADDAWWQLVSHEYADNVQVLSSGYMTGFNDGITNGYDWYSTDGSRQDYMNYYLGCREVTIELSNTKQLDSGQLENHWTWNRQALIDYILQVHRGIHGVVTDASGRGPVAATVTVVGHDDPTRLTRMFTDPDVGDYHRPIEAGTWDLLFTAAGYHDATVNGVVVNGTMDPVTVDVQMTALPSRSISGFITESGTGSPIAGASVTLTDTTIPGVTTGGDGSYAVADVYDGQHTLRVQALGYDTVTQTISVAPGQTVFNVALEVVSSSMDEDFESDDGSFESNEPTGWEWGTDGTMGASSGSRIWGTDLNSDYSDSATWTLDSKVVALPADLTSAELVFDHRYQTESGWDGGQMQIAVDGGAFTVLVPDGGYPDSDVDGIGDGEPGYSGNSGSWNEVRCDLSAHIGHNVQIRWLFGSDSSYTDEGWFIDDVRVLTTGGSVDEVFADGFESGGMGAWSATN